VVALQAEAQVRRVLAALAALNDSPSAGVLTPAESPRLIAAVALEDRHLAAVGQAWTRHRDLLSGGEAVRMGPFVVLPVIGARGLCALLCLDRLDEALCPPATRDLLVANLARALARHQAGPHELPPPEDLKRGLLLQRLETNEWNLARVARVYKVTRRTVYNWLERYGIPRKRIPRRA
jgi:transcriptional regulator with GAF, ATPase, and Fis domain